ncbi:MAG: hypothetical protein HZB26_00625 [Candidatus Hydrogenedentes bacterium]|nr:hypothetical protein [Candidatus Hydrogenedentota bacterium]
MNQKNTMLNIAELTIRHRAELDGYKNDDYDAVEDPEGYIVSILVSLQHWCNENEINWNREVTMAARFVKADKREQTDE